MVAAQAKLTHRAVHAVADDAAQLRLLDLDVARKLGADKRRDDMIALVEVLSTAHDLEGFGSAVGAGLSHVDHAHPHMVGIGVRFLGDDLGRDHVVERGAGFVNTFDTGARKVEPVAESLRVCGHVNVLAEPLKRYLHSTPS